MRGRGIAIESKRGREKEKNREAWGVKERTLSREMQEAFLWTPDM